MSDSFNRIERNFGKMGGQPFIRNTNISVNQIINHSINGQTLDEILEIYPDLSVEDIHQALAFAIEDMSSGISYWRHDGMTPLTQIKGYSEILVGKTDFDDIDKIPEEQKQQWLNIIHSSSQRGIARWQQMSLWLAKHYLTKTDEDDFDVYVLDRFLADIAKIAHNYEPSLILKFASVKQAIHIQTNGDTSLIIAGLLAYAKNTFKPETRITFDVKKQHIMIHLHRQLIYADDNIDKLITTPYSPVATAQAYFFSQDMNFAIDQEEDIIIFSVAIPLWEE